MNNARDTEDQGMHLVYDAFGQPDWVDLEELEAASDWLDERTQEQAAEAIDNEDYAAG